MRDLNGVNVVLTGLPRSGTTLSCHLLNRLPSVVALHEPMKASTLFGLGHTRSRRRAIAAFFEATRKSIVDSRVAPSKIVDGQVPDNPISDSYSDSGLRQSQASLGEISIDEDVSDDFPLIIKHPAAFTALLPELVNDFPCYALIRNPLSVLTSWNTVALPISRGLLPAGESLDLRLAFDLHRIGDRVDRQIHILSWFYEKYSRLLPEGAIIRYEDLIDSHGKALAAVVREADRLDVHLRSKNRNVLYDRQIMLRLADRLLGVEGAFWDFYSRRSVEALVQDETRARSSHSPQAADGGNARGDMRDCLNRRDLIVGAPIRDDEPPGRVPRCPALPSSAY